MAIEHHVVLSCLVQKMGTPHFQWMKNMSRLQFLHFLRPKLVVAIAQKMSAMDPLLTDLILRKHLLFAGISWQISILVSWDLVGWIWVSSQDMKHDFLNLFDTFCWDFLGLVNHHAVFVATDPHGKWWALEDDFSAGLEPAPWNRGHSVGILLPAGLTRTDIFHSTNRCQKQYMPTMLLTFTDLFQDSSVNCAFSLSSDFVGFYKKIPC